MTACLSIAIASRWWNSLPVPPESLTESPEIQIGSRAGEVVDGRTGTARAGGPGTALLAAPMAAIRLAKKRRHQPMRHCLHRCFSYLCLERIDVIQDRDLPQEDAADDVGRLDAVGVDRRRAGATGRQTLDEIGIAEPRRRTTKDAACTIAGSAATAVPPASASALARSPAARSRPCRQKSALARI